MYADSQEPSPRAPVVEILKAAATPEQGLALLRSAYPAASDDDILTALKSAPGAAKATAPRPGANGTALPPAEPLLSKDPTMQVAEAMRRLPLGGTIEAATAGATMPAAELFNAAFDAAVAIDPAWTKEGDIYPTPEALVRAYLTARNDGKTLRTLEQAGLLDPADKSGGFQARLLSFLGSL